MNSCKRILCTLAVVAYMLAILIACSRESGGGTELQTGEEAETGLNSDISAIEELEPYEINWYIPCCPQKDTRFVEEEASRYLIKALLS